MREMLMCALVILSFASSVKGQKADHIDKLTIQSYEQDGEMNEVTYECEAARNVNIPEIINQNRHLKRLIISGVIKSAQQTDVINFDSNKLSDQDGSEICKQVKTTTRPYLGVIVKGRDDLAGVDVREVIEYSPADIGGILPSESITYLNDEVINSYCDLQNALRNTEIGELVAIEVKENAKKRTIQVRMGERITNSITYTYCDEVPEISAPIFTAFNAGVAGFNTYPNPTRSITQWNFNSESVEPITLSIVDMKGNLIHEEKHNAFSKQLNGVYDFETQSSGTYLLMVRQGDKVYESKVLLMKM